MLRISRLTDYAIVLASQLCESEGPHAVRDLAAATGIPQPTVSKVLKQLTRSGVVESQRGAHGGYKLAESAEGIGIDQVIAAIEGPIAVTECTDEESESDCAYEPHCGVRANWQKINVAVQQALSAITVADMARASAPNLVSLTTSAAEADAKRRVLPQEEN